MSKPTDLGRCISNELNSALAELGISYDDRDRVTAVLVKLVVEVARKSHHGYKLEDTTDHQYHSGFSHWVLGVNRLNGSFDPMAFSLRRLAQANANELNEKSARDWADFVNS